MKAVSYDRHGGSGVMRIVEADTPTPGPGEILIRVAAASINPLDWKLRNGMLREHFEAQFPVIPGRDGSGSVVAHGEELDEVHRDKLAVGQRVCFVASRLFHGTHAEYAAVTATDNVVPIPDDLDYATAAALALGGVSAWNAVVETAAVDNGMRVLVHGGSGGIGSLAIQLCQSLGAETWATSSAAKADAVEGLGANVIRHDEVDFATAISDCNVVIDTVGGAVHERSYPVLKPGGRLVYVLAAPFQDRSAEFGVQTLQAEILHRTASLRQVVENASAGKLRPLLGHVAALAEYRDAFAIAEAGRVAGKVILTLGD